MGAYRPDSKSVFLNVPFDTAYECLFVALIAALVSIGRKPRCVLELPAVGQGRLERIHDHLETCRVSVHDLSRIGTPVRFNMPFELGLACALRRQHGNHDFILLERKKYRLDRTLSDVKGIDPYIHNGRIKDMIVCVLNALGTEEGSPSPAVVERMARDLLKVTRELKRTAGSATVFSRHLFYQVVTAGASLAATAGLIPS